MDLLDVFEIFDGESFPAKSANASPAGSVLGAPRGSSLAFTQTMEQPWVSLQAGAIPRCGIADHSIPNHRF